MAGPELCRHIAVESLPERGSGSRNSSAIPALVELAPGSTNTRTHPHPITMGESWSRSREERAMKALQYREIGAAP
ncbi:hypothetical protein GCM10009854_18080 [Saccharopolyspora halophila]|uniref:Uncharacterized protein n=1 Tax=Saccharopolyspora halophila TaxID=405551 RepID=A0ABP5SYV3_9PSEU